MSKAMEGLKEAFAGESQANRKYLAFAKKADEEGFALAARMFRAAAAAETVHAHAHLKAMGAIGSTVDNLKSAIEGEVYEFTQMYPPFIEAAKEEGNKAALRSFEYANQVEDTHAKLFQKVLDNLSTTTENYPFYVCQICGHTTERSFPETCPVCGAKSNMANMID